MMGRLDVTPSYEEWLEEFIMINSDPNRGSTCTPVTRREYYAQYCDPDTDMREIYPAHGNKPG